MTALAAAGAWPARSQDQAGDPARVIDALRLTEGSVVAEIGAGDGSLTIALARHVGSAGRVFTTELGDDRLTSLRQAVEASGLAHVDVVPAMTDSTNLAAACCDAIVMRDVYHHFSEPAVMNASLLAALRPGGRLAILDFEPRESAARSPEGRARGGQHGVARDDVAGELAAAGFAGVTAEPITGRRFIVVARKP